jgi:hypothetical protein
VLCVGALDSRKNQLMLAEALRETSLRLLLVGPSFEPDYLELCQAAGAIHVDRIPREEVVSGYHAARAHVLASFAEGSALASMEAAAARCPVVVSNRTSEFEYYLDLAYYCDPASVDSIRSAALAAAGSRGDARWDRLAERIATYTWERSAAATLEVYERLLAPGRSIAGARSFVVSVLAEDALTRPELLADYTAVFGPDDDATLVIEASQDQLADLEATVSGLDIDMIALDRVPVGAVNAVYGRGLTADVLRAAAERHWAAAR